MLSEAEHASLAVNKNVAFVQAQLGKKGLNTGFTLAPLKFRGLLR